MFESNEKIQTMAKQVVTIFIEKGLTLSTAESCTGGGVAAAITTIPGSSQMFKGAVVAYSNEIKSDVLNVDSVLLDKFGAVSEETVLAMARGVRKLMKTDVSISTSGIAGPTGATQGKPIGLVYFSVSDDLGSEFDKMVFEGSRKNVQKGSVLFVLCLLIDKYS